MATISKREIANLGGSQRRLLARLGFRTPMTLLMLSQDPDPRAVRLVSTLALFGEVSIGVLDWGIELIRLARNAEGGAPDRAAHTLQATARPEIRWSTREFFGDELTDRNRQEISRALRLLERKQLLTRIDGTRGRGAKRRTRYVRLTMKGTKLAYALIVAPLSGRYTSNEIYEAFLRARIPGEQAEGSPAAERGQADGALLDGA